MSGFKPLNGIVMLSFQEKLMGHDWLVEEIAEDVTSVKVGDKVIFDDANRFIIGDKSFIKEENIIAKEME